MTRQSGVVEKTVCNLHQKNTFFLSLFCVCNLHKTNV